MLCHARDDTWPASCSGSPRCSPALQHAGLDHQLIAETCMCAAVVSLQVNLPAGDYYRLQQRAAESDFISQVLCVTADHNPSLGRSYPGVCWARGPVRRVPGWHAVTPSTAPCAACTTQLSAVGHSAPNPHALNVAVAALLWLQLSASQATTAQVAHGFSHCHTMTAWLMYRLS